MARTAEPTRIAAFTWKEAATALVALLAILALALGATAVFADNAQALSAKNKAAHKAYQSKCHSTSLARNGSIGYCYKDIDGDNVDELILDNGIEAYGIQLYTYKSGKVKKLFAISHGQYSRYWAKTKTLYAFSGHMGITRDTYCHWDTKKSKVTVVAQRITDTNPLATGGKEVYTYQVKEKTPRRPSTTPM